MPKGISIPMRDDATSWAAVDRYVRHYAERAETCEGTHGAVVPQVYSPESLEQPGGPRGGQKAKKKKAKTKKKKQKKKKTKMKEKKQAAKEAARGDAPSASGSSSDFADSMVDTD